MKNKLIIIAPEGVLLDNQTNGLMGGIKDVLVLLGKGEEVRRIDEEYQKRKYQGPWGLEQLAQLYKGFSMKKLEATSLRYMDSTLREGVYDFLLALKAKRIIIGAISANPQFIMNALQNRLPLDFSVGLELEFDKGVATGRIKTMVDRYVKAQILREKMETYVVGKEGVSVIGGSVSDLPMAELAGRFIAFQSKDESVNQKATLAVKSFQEILEKGAIL